MSRFDEFMKKHGMDTNTVRAGDEEVMAENPRNALADFVNPLLDKSVNKILPQDYALNIPKQTVADEKNFYNNLPENMAMAGMGSIGQVEQNLGKAILKPSRADLIAEAGNVGKVTVKPSAADMAADAMKAVPAKQLKGQEISNRFKELFGDATDKTVESIARTQKAKHAQNPGAYDSWKQEMLGKIGRGEI